MTPSDPLAGVDVLIPRRIRDRQRQVVQEHRLDLAALLEALSPASSPALADADPDAARAWVMRAIRALPTQADATLALMEDSLGAV